MALTATIYKAELAIADIDRNYYASHNLTLARHPSETEERLMTRLLAFILYADERLTFGKGLSDGDEPDLWLKDYDGTIRLWIELGQPDEKQLRRAAGRAEQVVVMSYGNAGPIWWRKQQPQLARISNLVVLHLAEPAQLTPLCQRSMKLQATLQEGELLLTNGELSLTVNVERFQG